jgi:hypothetical protein
MVAALQFLRAGVTAGERSVLVSNADMEGALGVARAWGVDLEPAWRSGPLQLLGFKEDFELRALRSIEPEEILEELDAVVGQDAVRVAIDPGSMLLAGGARSQLGSAFLKWARMHPATVVSTFSVDGPAASLPSFADWLVHATTGRLIVERRGEDLYDLSLANAAPAAGEREESVTVQLVPGTGLVAPQGGLSRRGRDRPGVDVNRLLLISLGGTHSVDMDLWARGAFRADVATEPFEAIARVQADASFGGVLVYASRTRVREAVTACRALRPLTRAAIVFASDDAVRSTDRIHILEAGADDCLTGGLDFRELGLRIRHAIEHGSRPAPAAWKPTVNGLEGGGGRVPPDRFREEITRRAADPVSRYFCVLDVSPGSLAPSVVEQILVEQVRADAGDLVTTDSNRCAVLLQGARQGQLATFLDRLRARLRERAGDEAHGGEPDVQVLSHPAESARIRSLLAS